MAESVLHRMLGSYRDCVSRFIVPSRFYLEKFVEWGFPRERFAHVPNFVDAARYAAQFAPGKSFLYFGRISREKGVATLIRAAAEARVPLEIAGTGPQQQELAQLASELGADVKFLGYLTGEALHEVVRRARAVVLPSEWYENAPMSILEAYALGKPVIGATIGGIPELIREGVTGVTFTSGEAASLSAALRDIASRADAELENMGREGRDWVSSEFTAAGYRQRIADTYRALGVDSLASPA
jgi:glycosyltransferase involved in cell wall biosynthesis